MKSPPRQAGWRLGLAVLTLLAVVFGGCVSPNDLPVITSIKAEKERVALSGSSRIECIAADPDGDNLTYTWTATGGTFSGTGPVAIWTAPDVAGIYTIMVTVTDDRGGEATMQLTMDVQVNRPPLIEHLTAEPAVVGQNARSIIKCVASDPDGDELSYQWAATAGEIFGQGMAIDWVAPGTCGNYTVTVTVMDGMGGEVRGEVEIEVEKRG